MIKPEYSPQQALETIIRKVYEREPRLAEEIAMAVDSGKDTVEKEPPPKLGSKKLRTYRKAAPYSHQEAIEIALNVLNAHFVEQPMLVNSLLSDMDKALLEQPPQSDLISPKLIGDAATFGKLQKVEFELHPETQISGSNSLDILVAEHVPQGEIDEQRENLNALKILTDFGEN